MSIQAEGTDIRSILNRAGKPEDFAQPHIRASAHSTDNIKRIAEFITKLTWREITTIALAVETEYKKEGPPDLAEAFVIWAEKLLEENA